MTESNKNFLSSTEKYAKIVIVIASSYAGIIFALYFWRFNTGFSDETSTWGQFGDFIGGTINPFFGLLSLLALLWTLIIQSKELSHSTTALQEQSQHLNLQAFENTFFSLIRLNNDIAQSIDLRVEDSDEASQLGRSAFRQLITRLKHAFEAIETNDNNNDAIHIAKEAYKVFHYNNQIHVGSYLNTLERTLEFINQRCPLQKDDYVSIVISQLTTHELLIIFHYSLGATGALNIDKLNHYYFFQNLPDDKLLKSIHKDLIERKQ